MILTRSGYRISHNKGYSRGEAEYIPGLGAAAVVALMARPRYAMALSILVCMIPFLIAEMLR